MSADNRIGVGPATISYQMSGEGEPALYVHGVATWSFIWRPVTAVLDRRFRNIVYDLPGEGYSTIPPEEDLSPLSQMHLLVKFMDVLGLKDVHLICHDVGGAIGQLMAVNHPERIKTLTLLNPVGYNYWPVQPISALRVPLLRQLGIALFDTGLFRAIIRRGLFHKDEVDKGDLLENFHRPLATPEGKRAFLRLLEGLNNKQLMVASKKFDHIDFPVLLVRGEKDSYLQREICERLHKDIPGSRYEKVLTAGHFIQVDEPVKTAELIEKFIDAAVKDG